jgi:two-component system cell cycle response regulator
MAGDGTKGLALGAVAMASGVAALLADLPALGAVAGLAGLAAGGVAASAAHRADEIESRRAVAADELAVTTRYLREAGDRIDALELAATEAVEHPDDPVHDPATGLPGSDFFDATLSSRVAAARRHLRPVAVVMVDVGERDGVRTDITILADHLRLTLREADLACRLEGEAQFGLILDDTPENGAVWTVERFRRALAGGGCRVRLWAGIACYPAHAFDADELRARAGAALDAARQWHQDRIEVATASEV